MISYSLALFPNTVYKDCTTRALTGDDHCYVTYLFRRAEGCQTLRQEQFSLTYHWRNCRYETKWSYKTL